MPGTRMFTAANTTSNVYESDSTSVRTRRSVPEDPAGRGTNWMPRPAIASHHHRSRIDSNRDSRRR